MATEERRYEVFVSSTFFDLQQERAAVSKVLLEMDAFPAGMELFPATDADSWTLIQQVIDSADYYLLIIGGRYGSIDDTTELSYTEMEYDYAVEKKKPVMAFLHGEPGKIEADKTEMDAAGREKLEAFRAKVEKAKHVKFWTGKDELGGQVATTFASFRKTYKAVGWIRGDVETSTESLKENNDLRKRIAELEAKQEAIGREPPPGSDRLSQGTDVADLQLEYSWYGDLQHVGDEDADTLSTHIRQGGTIEPILTWDQLLSAIGPGLLDETEEGGIKKALNEWLSAYAYDDAEEDIRALAARNDLEVVRTRSNEVSMPTQGFGTLIVQFSALGLIQKGIRKRGVHDKGTYWVLTPLGSDHLTALRAIRRPDPFDATGKANQTVVPRGGDAAAADN